MRIRKLMVLLQRMIPRNSGFTLFPRVGQGSLRCFSRSFPLRTMSAHSRATSVPAPMATPTVALPKARHFTKSNSESFLARVRRLSRGGRRQLSESRHHPPGHGQFEFAQAHGAGEPIRRKHRRLALGPVHRALHKHSSWLNHRRSRLSLFSRQCPGKRRIPSLPGLQQETQAWNRKMNRDRVYIN